MGWSFFYVFPIYNLTAFNLFKFYVFRSAYFARITGYTLFKTKIIKRKYYLIIGIGAKINRELFFTKHIICLKFEYSETLNR